MTGGYRYYADLTRTGGFYREDPDGRWEELEIRRGRTAWWRDLRPDADLGDACQIPEIVVTDWVREHAA